MTAKNSPAEDPSVLPRKSDPELVNEAAAAVLGSAIQIENPWTKAALLDASAELYRHYGINANIDTPEGAREHTKRAADDE